MAVQGNQRLLTTQGQRAEQRRVLGFLADQRPARLWIFTGANEDRNVAAHGGQQRGRVQHFRAESRHFSRFFKGDHVNTFCRRDHARVGGVDTRHVRPDIHAGGVQGFTQQGGGVVATATAQRGCAPFGFAADKALGDHYAFIQARGKLLVSQLSQGFHVRLGAAKAVAGAHHFTHVEPLRLNIALAHDLNEQQGGHQFAVADQFIGQCA